MPREARGRAIEDAYHHRWLKPEDEKAACYSLATTRPWRSANLHATKSGEEHGSPAGVLGEGDEPVALLGVGIRAMQERMQQLGGRLEIESSGKGTTVRAILLLSERHS